MYQKVYAEFSGSPMPRRLNAPTRQLTSDEPITFK